MTAAWDLPDFDDHEGVHLFRDRASGLTAVIAIHSTALGAGAGGTRFWHYADRTDAITDALRLSRGMSYKNAMAGLPLGGAKGVILADAAKTKTPAMLEAFGRAVDSLGGRYVTAEDVGISESDMITISKGHGTSPACRSRPVMQGAIRGRSPPMASIWASRLRLGTPWAKATWRVCMSPFRALAA